MRLKDKISLITGAGRGIGRASAMLFAKEGASIVIADIDEEGGQKTRSDIIKGGGKAIFIKTDLSKNEDVKNLIKKTIDEFGKLHILYNNAGVFWKKKDGCITDIDEDIWDKILDINLKSTYLCCKYAIPEIIKSGGGSVINTASSAGVIGVPGCDAYTATKGAIVSMTRSMAAEYGLFNVRVNCIVPTHIYTPMFEESTKNVAGFDENKFLETFPLGKYGKPEDIANAALFLASDESSFTTGSMVTVDGGATSTYMH
ncbi:MAG: SDR family NAD(P)-dependent oxidoreductase [Candidatus Humimicrobiaceae bacterium]